MNKQVYKDTQKRKYILKTETRRAILQSVKNNEQIINLTRWNASIKLTKHNFNYFPTQLNRRCVVTGRKNIINKHYRLSRLCLLNYARKGLINGLIKSMR